MKVIWKFGLSEKEQVPRGYRIRSIGLDPNGMPSAWIEVDPAAKTTNVKFVKTFTGNEVPDKVIAYLGYIIQGPLVFHVWHCYDPENM